MELFRKCIVFRVRDSECRVSEFGKGLRDLKRCSTNGGLPDPKRVRHRAFRSWSHWLGGTPVRYLVERNHMER